MQESHTTIISEGNTSVLSGLSGLSTRMQWYTSDGEA